MLVLIEVSASAAGSSTLSTTSSAFSTTLSGTASTGDSTTGSSTFSTTLSGTASTGDSTTFSTTSSTLWPRCSLAGLAGPSPTSPVSKHGSKAFADDPPAAASASKVSIASSLGSGSEIPGA